MENRSGNVADYPQGAWKLFFDVCASCSNLRLSRQRNGKASAGRSKNRSQKKYHAFLLRFDPELPRLPELEEEYRQMGLRVRNDGCDKFDLIQPRYNMILKLDEPTFEELMPHFSEKTRYNIRLSARKGVTVHWSRSEEDLKKFF